MTKIKDLEKRVARLEPDQPKTTGEDDKIRKVLAGLSEEEQANLACVIVSREKEEQRPDFNEEQWIASLPSDQQVVLKKVEHLLQATAQYVRQPFSLAPIELQIALRAKELESTPGAFDTGPDLETMSTSQSRREARQKPRKRGDSTHE